MTKQLFSLPMLFPDPDPGTLGSPVTQKLMLKFANDLYYSRKPGQNRNIKFTVTFKKGVIFIVGTDNVNSKMLKNGEVDHLPKGKSGFLLAIPKLFFVDRTGSNRIYKFGQDGGEGNNDDATVQLKYVNAIPSVPGPPNQPPIMISVEDDEIMMVTNSSTESGPTGTKSFLKADASSANPVTVTINRNANQGNVIVCVFNARNGSLLAKLNPKDPDNPADQQSFTSDDSIYIIPVIRPKVNSINGKDRINFEVGDPEENGSVESEEE